MPDYKFIIIRKTISLNITKLISNSDSWKTCTSEKLISANNAKLSEVVNFEALTGNSCKSKTSNICYMNYEYEFSEFPAMHNP